MFNFVQLLFRSRSIQPLLLSSFFFELGVFQHHFHYFQKEKTFYFVGILNFMSVIHRIYTHCFPIFCCNSIITARVLSSAIINSATRFPNRSKISTSSLKKVEMVQGAPPNPLSTERASPEGSLASLPTYLQMHQPGHTVSVMSQRTARHSQACCAT